MLCAHKLMDDSDETTVHMVTDGFEVGMYGETPGILPLTMWPLARPHWLSETGFRHPEEGDTAIRSSWMKKSMAISLATRGAHFHTGTRTCTNNRDERSLALSYPGSKTSTKISYDHIVEKDARDLPSWNGAIVTELPSWSCVSGKRPDGTFEVWWQGGDHPISPLQVMQWRGLDPTTALESHASLADAKLANIKNERLAT